MSEATTNEATTNEDTKMITECPQELIDKWREKGIEWGLDTTPVDPERMVPIVQEMYAKVLQQEPPKPEDIILCPSPKAAWEELVKREQEPNEPPLTFMWPFLDGQWAAHYAAWVGCYRDLGLELDIPALDANIATKDLGPMYPLPNYCLVSDKPREVNLLEEDGNLHCETGMAVRYSDGCGMYALNGVSVPEPVVMTPLDEIDKAWLKEHFIGEDNVDVKREVLRRVGIDLVVRHLDAKVLDTETIYIDAEHYVHEEEDQEGLQDITYELLEIDLGDGDVSKALKMQNASMPDVYHVEGVPNEALSVMGALEFRNGFAGHPAKLA